MQQRPRWRGPRSIAAQAKASAVLDSARRLTQRGADDFLTNRHAVKAAPTYDEKESPHLLGELTSAGPKVLRQLQRFESMPECGRSTRVPDRPMRPGGNDPPRDPRRLHATPTARSTLLEKEDLISRCRARLRPGALTAGLLPDRRLQECWRHPQTFGDTDAIEVRIEADGCRVVKHAAATPPTDDGLTGRFADDLRTTTGQGRGRNLHRLPPPHGRLNLSGVTAYTFLTTAAEC